jgi:four helix bundle protein
MDRRNGGGTDAREAVADRTVFRRGEDSGKESREYCCANLGKNAKQGEVMKQYTKLHNINRGYMKLEVWQEALELFELVVGTVGKIEGIDLRLRSQIYDAAQSISSNIAEGYCRRTINEYLQYLNVALGSSGELLTRLLGLDRIRLLSESLFEPMDRLHYSVENKLIALVRSLQLKRKRGDWIEEFVESRD